MSLHYVIMSIPYVCVIHGMPFGFELWLLTVDVLLSPQSYLIKGG